MSAPIEHIRLSQQAKDQLIKLKKTTGIEHWNVLCRWAFCASLAEGATPPNTRIPADSNIEMTWRVFAGPCADIFLALLKERCRIDGLECESDTLATQFRLHLHRGITYLASNKSIKNISGLMSSLAI